MQDHASNCNSRLSHLGMHAKSDRSLLQRRFQCPSDHTPSGLPHLSPNTTKTPQDLTNHLFLRRLHYRAAAFHRSVRWIGSDPNQGGNSGATPTLRTIFPLRNLESLSVCLEMCSVLICFQLFPSWAVSPRQSYLFHVILFLFTVFAPSQPLLTQFHHYPQADSYISLVWDRGQLGDPGVRVDTPMAQFSRCR
jgi:hypothetical protein